MEEGFCWENEQWVPAKYKHFALKNRRALYDEWRLNGPHSDCVTNKINIQNDF